MALQDLLQKIKDEANKKAALMKQTTSDELKKVKKETADKIGLRKGELEQKTEEKMASILEKAKTLAQMEGRSQTLKDKREVIDMAYENVLKELNQMSSGEYTNLVVTMLKFVSNEFPKGNLLIPTGREKESEEALSKAGLDYHINKDHPHDFKGGFVLTSGKVEINMSFQYLVQKIIRPATELNVAQTLFG